MYTGNLIKVTLLGDLQGTDEIFSTAFHIGVPDGSVSGEQWSTFGVTAAQEIADRSVELWSEPNMRIPSEFRLLSVKFALIGPDGLYLEDPIEIEVTPTGGAGIYGYAPQLALVATLVSSKRKDPGRYNRMYFPTTIVSMYGGTYLDQGTQTTFATAVANYFGDIRAIVELLGLVSLTPVVVSAKGTGITTQINDIRVGRVLDTQRRRRNKLQEQYVQVNVIE